MNQNEHLKILADGVEGLADPLDPQGLAAAHPAWERALADCARWERARAFWTCTGEIVPAFTCVCGQCSSSLDVAWHLVRQGVLPEWGAVLAVSQRSGRGQLRRPWSSPPGNLYAAWRWPALPEGFAPLASLAAGYVAALGLEMLGQEVRIKWPNDLLTPEGRKVGGILVEERDGVTLVGLGLNLVSAPPDAEIRERFSPRAGVLSPLGDEKSAICAWHALVDSARYWYEAFASSGNPRHFLDHLEPRIAWLGHTVRVWGAGDDFTAVPVGLAEDGGLILRQGSEHQILYSGSIALT